MAHDDGQLPWTEHGRHHPPRHIAHIKAPTSIYLAQRGYKTANLPLVPGIEPPGR
jgi:hypothetical protein